MNIVVVDDHVLFRKALIAIMEESPIVDKIYEASNYIELFEILQDHDPDLITLDLELPGMDGIEICEQLMKKHARQKILILTMYDSDELLGRLVGLGVNGYLIKNAEPDQIFRAIKVLEHHDIFYDRRIVEILRKTLLDSKRISEDLHTGISPKELKILRLICKEHTSSEIADKLKISLRSVEKIRSNLIRKTNSKNVVGLIKYAYRNKLIIFS